MQITILCNRKHIYLLLFYYLKSWAWFIYLCWRTFCNQSYVSTGKYLPPIFYEEKIMASINDFKNTKELTQYHESMRMNCRGDNHQLVETLNYAQQHPLKNDNQADASFGFVLGYN